jgi:chaperone required for assembly of F1-ATPase
MRDLLYSEHQPSEPDPVRRAQNAMARHHLPKRFYTDVSTAGSEGGFAILLDGRGARTPGRNRLALPTRAAAECLAAEWRAQEDVIDPARMHATRIANTAIDSFDGRIGEIQRDIAAYAASDLVCYRASEPEGLVAAQNLHWNPVLDWAHDALGARFILAEGIVHQAQPEPALISVQAAASRITQPIALAAMHVMTTMSGSCLIAMMAGAGALSGKEAWRTSTVDEDWNASLWGWDEDALRRHAKRQEEFLATHALYRAIA